MSKIIQRVLIVCTFVVLLTVVACTAPQVEEESSAGAVMADLEDGTYQGTAKSHGGDLTVEMVAEGGVIRSLKVVSNSDDAEYADKALEPLPTAIVEAQRLDVDVVTGATMTSRGIIAATANAVRDAGANPKEYGYVATGEVADEQMITIKGISEEDVVISGEEIKAYTAESVDAVSVDASGDEKPTSAKGVYLETLLAEHGTSQKDYGSLIITATDGYAIEIPADVLAKRDILIAYEVNGEDVDLRSVVPEERAMYWVKFIETIELLNPKEVVETKEVLFQESLIVENELTIEDYKFEDSVDEAVTIEDILAATGRTDEFVTFMGLDGWNKTEKWDLATNQYMKITGDDAPMFVGPDLPKGMLMKENLYMKLSDVCILSGQMLEMKIGTDGSEMTISTILEVAGLIEGENYELTLQEGSTVIDRVTAETMAFTITEGEIYVDIDGTQSKVLSIRVGE